jgi:hypothetical protein
MPRPPAVVTALCLWLAGGLFSLAQADVLTIDHNGAGCVVAGKFVQLDARVVPADQVGQYVVTSTIFASGGISSTCNFTHAFSGTMNVILNGTSGGNANVTVTSGSRTDTATHQFSGALSGGVITG